MNFSTQDLASAGLLFVSLVIQITFLVQIIRLLRNMRTTANIRTFLVKGSFSFDAQGKKVALCSYYHENLIHEEANDKGIDFAEYLVGHAPNFEFETQPLSKSVQCGYNLPGRLLVSKESVEGKKKLFLSNPDSMCLFVMAKPENFGPYDTFWIGTCIQTDNMFSYKRILKEYKRREKKGLC